jgi:hypothetical protein
MSSVMPGMGYEVNISSLAANFECKIGANTMRGNRKLSRLSTVPASSSSLMNMAQFSSVYWNRSFNFKNVLVLSSTKNSRDCSSDSTYSIFWNLRASVVPGLELYRRCLRKWPVTPRGKESLRCHPCFRIGISGHRTQLPGQAIFLTRIQLFVACTN